MQDQHSVTVFGCPRAGRGGRECAQADGRELWVLGEIYDMGSMREWLLREGVDESNFGAVCEFGLVPEGVNRLGLHLASRRVCVFGRPGHAGYKEGLRGVGRDAVKIMATTLAEYGQEQGIRLGWRYVRRAVHLAELWVISNGGEFGGGDVSGFRDIVGGLDLLEMPLKVLRDVFGGCAYVDDAWLCDLVDRKQAAGDNLYEVEYKVERRYNFQELFSNDPLAGKIAFHGEGIERRMAVADMERNQIAIINVESGQLVAAVTPPALVVGQSFKAILCLAFSNSGELYVSDWELNRIYVFDRQGAHVRWFGRSGTEQGQFRHVRGLCFRNDGNLIVADSGNDRVQIIREDGTFVRAFGSRGSGDGMLDQPMDVCSRPDGSIAVLDNGNHRVVVFDRNGVFLRNIGSRGEGPGEFRFPCFVAAGRGGEIIVGDWWRNDVQIFSSEGEVLQVIGPEGDSIVQWPGEVFDDYCGFAGFAGADGRLFILDCMSLVVLSSDSSKSLA